MTGSQTFARFGNALCLKMIRFEAHTTHMRARTHSTAWKINKFYIIAHSVTYIP